MRQLIEVPLENGDSFLMEVDFPEDADELIRTASPGEIASRASMTFEEALDKVKPISAVLIEKLRGLTDAPDEISVSFGLKMSADAGIFVASAGIEANYTVTLKWSKD